MEKFKLNLEQRCEAEILLQQAVNDENILLELIYELIARRATKNEDAQRWRAYELLGDSEACEETKVLLRKAGFSIVADVIDIARGSSPCVKNVTVNQASR